MRAVRACVCMHACAYEVCVCVCVCVRARACVCVCVWALREICLLLAFKILCLRF